MSMTKGEVVATTAGSISAAAVALGLLAAITFSVAEDRQVRKEVKLQILEVCAGAGDVADCMSEAKESLD